MEELDLDDLVFMMCIFVDGKGDALLSIYSKVPAVLRRG